MLTRFSTPECSDWIVPPATQPMIGLHAITARIRALPMKAAVASIMAAQPAANAIHKTCALLPVLRVTIAITLTMMAAEAGTTINNHYNEKLRRVCGALRFLLSQKFATINSL